MAKVLVTGGAGYIGTHVVKLLLEENYEIVVYDNFSTGFLKPLNDLTKIYKNISIINGDLTDQEKVDRLFLGQKIDFVVHLAAAIDAAESVKMAEKYYQQNYLNSVNLINTMLKYGVRKIVFASTAAVYGNPKYLPIGESHPTQPQSPYGQSKLDVEKYLAQCDNLQYVVLRFFNVAGSDSDGALGRSQIKSGSLIENIFKVALGQKDRFEIFGDKYPTKDGTPTRDLIHVEDIATAILNSIIYLDRLNAKSEIINLGSQSGFTVLEIVKTAQEIIGKKFPIIMSKNRDGDVIACVASAQKAKQILNWQAQKSDLKTIISSDWAWRKKHPRGYRK